MKMYLYGKQKADIQKRYEAWLQQHDSIQSANKDETIVSVIKRFFGGTYNIQINTNAE